MTNTHADTHIARFWQHRCGRGKTREDSTSGPSLRRLSARHAIVCNNKSKTFKAGQVKRRIIGRSDGVAKGESGEEASWFIFKDTPYCIFNNFPWCAGKTRQFTSTTLEFTPLLRQVAHEAHAGLSSPGLIAFLTLLFYHSSFPSLQGSESQAAEDLQMYMDANTLS